VWVQVYAKVATYDDGGGSPTPPADATAVFYVNNDGDLKAYSGNAWVVLTTLASPTAASAFAVHLDYKARKWDLYYRNSNVPGDALVKANATALSFKTGAISTKLTSVTVDTETAGNIDAVALTNEKSIVPVNDSSAANLLSVRRKAKQSVLCPLPPYAYADDANRTLGGTLGNDLKKGLVNGDHVQFYDYSDVGVKSFEDSLLDTGAWVGSTAIKIPPGAGVWIDRSQSTADTYAFYSYGSLPGNDPAQEIFDSTEIGGGWNPVIWPYSLGAATQAGDGWDFSPVAGDRLWIYENNIYLVLRYDAGVWKKVGETAASNYALKPGQPFWYQRKSGAGSFSWVPD
jgi:hypothetical protein